MLEPTELARWTRFAVKGGIGKCTATQDCVAEHAEDLMFLKDDVITVLMQVQEEEGVFLGYCEGVVGRFNASHVHFHSKLKKPVMTKRSSTVASRPSSSKSTSTGTLSAASPDPEAESRHTGASITRTDIIRDVPSIPVSPQASLGDESPVSPSASDSLSAITTRMATASTDSAVSEPNRLATFDMSRTLSSASSLSQTSQSPSDLDSMVPPLMRDHSSSSSLTESFPVTPLTASSGHTSAAPGLAEKVEDVDVPPHDPNTRGSVMPPGIRRSVAPVTERVPSSGPPGSPPAPRRIVRPRKSESGSLADAVSLAPSDGEVGIGLSFLQDLPSATDLDDWSSTKSGPSALQGDRVSEPQERSLTISPEAMVDNQGLVGERTPSTSTTAPDPPARSTTASQPQSPSSPSQRSVFTTGSDWEDTFDIYDDYRYSRQSFASKMSSSSLSPVSGLAIGTAPAPPPVPSEICSSSDHSQSSAPTKCSPATERRTALAPIRSKEGSTSVSAQPSPVESLQPSSATLSAFVVPLVPPPPSADAPRRRPYDLSLTTFIPDSGMSRDSPTVLNAGLLSAESQATPLTPISPSRMLDVDSPITSLSAFPVPPGVLRMRSAITLPPAAPSPPPSPLPPSQAQTLPQSDPSEFRRRSVFLPHPNAPKPPPTFVGPLYARSRPAPPTQSLPDYSAVSTLRQATAAGRFHPDGSAKPVTLYGLCDVDLCQSQGPVLIRFGLEPPPRLPPLSASTDSPALATARPLNHKSSHLASPLSPMSAEPQTARALPRANFFPHVQTSRPRSRSFSGFDARMSLGVVSDKGQSSGGSSKLSLKVSADTPSSHPAPSRKVRLNESEDTPSRDARVQPSSPASFLHDNQDLKGGLGSLSPAPTSSPRVSSPLSPSSPIVSAGTKPNLSKLRHASSSVATQNEKKCSFAAQHRASTNPLPAVHQTYSDGNGRGVSSPNTSQAPPLERVSSESNTHSPGSELVAPVGRDRSLRQKMSLPSIRTKNMNLPARREDMSSLASPSAKSYGTDLETVQVKDMDFELIRPVLPQYSLRRSSEDTPVSPRDPFMGNDHTRLGVDSPALSLSSGANSGPRSPSPVSDYSLPAAGKGSHNPSSPQRTSIEAHRQRELRWMSLLSTVPAAQARKNKKVKRLLIEGVPSSVRYLVWAHLADSKAKGMQGLYSQLGNRGRVPASGEIERDAAKCFQDQPQLHGAQGPVVGLLQAYLAMVPDVRYRFGLTRIAGHLLLMSPEEDAFWIFVSLMDTHLRSYFSNHSLQLDVDASLLMTALENNDPVLAKRMFVDMGLSTLTICRPWFTSLFTESLPVGHLHRVWDIFLYEGIPFLLRVGLAIFVCMRRFLLECPDRDAIYSQLRSPSPSSLPATAEAFVSLVYSVKLKDDDVRKQRVKMETQLKRQTQTRPPLIAGSIGLATTISLPRS